MKRIIQLLLAACVLSLVPVANASAQKKTLTEKELQFRNGIERILKQEGYAPTIDNDDNSLNWKSDGASYWLTVKGEDPYYITMHIGGFNLNDANEKIALEACNYVNMNKRCVKACVDDGSVVFTTEYYCHSLQNFRDTFDDYMHCLSYSKDALKTYYNEHDN